MRINIIHITIYPLVNHEATGAQIAWIVPPMLSTAIIVAIGNKIAEMARPIMAIPQDVPDISPIRGGNTRLPAPKNTANMANPIIRALVFAFF